MHFECNIIVRFIYEFTEESNDDNVVAEPMRTTSANTGSIRLISVFGIVCMFSLVFYPPCSPVAALVRHTCVPHAARLRCNDLIIRNFIYFFYSAKEFSADLFRVHCEAFSLPAAAALYT